LKASAFEYERPDSREEAVRLLGAADRTVKVLAGGQSLGPMLNLRLALPGLLVDVTRIPELVRSEDGRDFLTLGACVTHAAIEDGDVIDVTRGMMRSVARGIAYRAVRNRGTIGGSLAHADPSADWPPTLTALSASLSIFGPKGSRQVPVAEFMVGAFETVLGPDEILEAIRIPKLSSKARWGYYKVCRKPGEFAEALAAVVIDPERDVRRAAIGATGAAPILIDDLGELLEVGPASIEAAVRQQLCDRKMESDPYLLQIQRVTLHRALEQVRSR
jgi:carbon-monoxide dehydrogenase medium subunit